MTGRESVGRRCWRWSGLGLGRRSELLDVDEKEASGEPEEPEARLTLRFSELRRAAAVTAAALAEVGVGVEGSLS